MNTRTEPVRPQSLDVFAHTNPAVVAAQIRWTCQGYCEQVEARRPEASRGLLIPWGIAATALISTGETFERLPKSSAASLTNLLAKNPGWRAALASSLDTWAPAFWRAVGFGVSRNILRLSEARVFPAGSFASPMHNWEELLRSRCHIFGKVLGKESDDMIGRALFGTILSPKGTGLQ